MGEPTNGYALALSTAGDVYETRALEMLTARQAVMASRPGPAQPTSSTMLYAVRPNAESQPRPKP